MTEDRAKERGARVLQKWIDSRGSTNIKRVSNADIHHREGGRMFDAINEETGCKYESKAAEPGRRFRVWKDQTDWLVRSDGQNCAYFIFIVADSNTNILNSKRRKPQTVREMVERQGGWNQAGHAGRDSKQHKIPIDDVI